MNNTDDHECLHRLAEAVGLSSQWHDHRGEDQTVSPEVLQAVLRSLEVPADTPRQCRDSLAAIKADEERQIPSLITGRTGEKLLLPPALRTALAASQTVELRNEDGGTLRVSIEQSGQGLCLPELAQPGYYTLETDTIQANLAIAPRQCTSVSERCGKQRSFGLAAQLYSLRRNGDGGIGNFTALKELAAACGACGADALAISPVHALFSADETRYSPYAPSSRLFLNALYTDPAATLGEDLVLGCATELGIQSELEDLEKLTLIDWPKAAHKKLALLHCIWAYHADVLLAGDGPQGRRFTDFRRQGGSALEQHAIFETLHAHQYHASPDRWHWRNWPDDLQDPDSPAVQAFAAEHATEVGFHCFLQWLAAEELSAAHNAGRDAGMGIGLIADLAIGTDSGGSHAWSRQQDVLKGVSVGAPPDLINHQGQNWGLTTFSPRALQAHGYKPFVEMLRAALRYAGGLRIDHVLGLRRLWLVPDGAKPAEGAYLNFPQQDLLNLIALESWRYGAIIVGEDLGTVPPGFRQKISDVGLLGMQVLWFEQDNGLYVDPSRWRSDAMATTTTHDLATVAGWWRGRDIEWNQELDRFPEGSGLEQEQQQRNRDRQALWAAFQYANIANGDLPGEEETETVVDKAVQFVSDTPSPLVLIPLEDMLAMVDQPNLPGTIDEHPNWRRRLPLPVEELLQEAGVASRLARLQARTQIGEK